MVQPASPQFTDPHTTMTDSRNYDRPISRIDPLRTSEQSSDRDSIRAASRPIESILQQIGRDSVFGTPITRGDTTVVPVTDVRTGFGYGSGHGTEDSNEGAGGGGGAALRMTPHGYLEITPDRVRYRPIYDVTPLLAGGAFLAWLVYRWATR